MNDLLQQFLIESRELVVQATDGLLLLEQTPNDAESVDCVFRAFHTLKGGAGIVEFPMMEHALHATESLLMEIRSGKRQLSSALIGDCLTSLDQVSEWLNVLEQTGELPAAGSSGNTTEASPLADTGSQTAPAADTPRGPRDWTADLTSRHRGVLDRAATAFRLTPDPHCFYEGEDPIARITSLNQLLVLEIQPANRWPPLDHFDPYTCNLVLTGLCAADVEEVRAQMQGHSGELKLSPIGSAHPAATRNSLPNRVRDVLKEQLALLGNEAPPGASGRLASAGLTAANAMRYCGLDQHAQMLTSVTHKALADGSANRLQEAIAQLLAGQAAVPSPIARTPRRAETSVRSLRVNAEQIDALVRLTGELTVAKNAIGHTALLAQTTGDSIAKQLKDDHDVLGRLVSQLQSSVIGMRVLPLSSVFQRFPRVLREMSSSLGKSCELRVEGEETVADRTIVEMLFEPLLHVIRNAIDHGIEDAAERRRKGKPALATLLIRARREGEQVLIEVSDDGAGIDLARVRRVAKDRGVATDEELGPMSDSDVIDLLFTPGFSTAARVTEISGRGVGMDAVRTAVEKVGGRVSIAGRVDLGTTVTFALPFSVMMTQVMTVEARGQVFGIPLDAVVETVRVGKEAFSGVGGAQVIVHRNRTIPVIELGGALQGRHERKPQGERETTVVIAAVTGQFVGLHVDRAGERMEVMLTPLGGLLSGTPGVAGTTVLGDGRILLVLDIAEML